MRPLLLLAVSLTALSPVAAQSPRTYTPREAIFAAADAADSTADSARVVRGVFDMTVRATGRQDGRLYLNSELDYRDQRNLTIAIEPPAESMLRSRLGGEDPATALIGRRISVSGGARRLPVRFYCEGKVTDKYYYQTHVRVVYGQQVRIVPDSSASRPGSP